MERVYFKNKEGLKLAGILHVPKQKPKTGIIICHGFTGGKDRNFIPELSRELQNRGFLVLRFDFSGNCESEGKFEDMTYTKYADDLDSAIDFLKNEVKQICVVGYSMGGSIGILQSVKNDKIKFLILISPGLEIVKKSFTKKQMGQLDKKGFLEFVDSWNERHRLNKEYFEDRKKYDFIKESKKLNIPTLIIAGKKDEVISIPKCKELYKLIKVRKRLVLIENEDHVFHNKVPNKMLNSIIGFLRTHSSG